MYGINFTSANPDPRCTAAGEMVTAVELLAEKASKFPSRKSGVYHLILADLRGYCAGNVDTDDCRQIAWGARAVNEEANVQFFGPSPVHGIFDSENTRERSVCAQQKIHAVGLFCGHRKRSQDVLSTRGSIYHSNPLLLTTEHEASYIPRLLDGGAV